MRKFKYGDTKAKKSLGQNFLIDDSAIGSIIKALDPKPKDAIVEIGPGHGELTIPLLNSGAKVIAIEKDFKLADSLEFLAYSKLKVLRGDALKLLSLFTTQLKATNYKLVGNIPYYITGFLLRKLGELKNKPSSIVLTIQKEVAERICAKPPEMNLLAASVQFWGKPEIIRIIPRESFDPVPKVDSAIIRITPLLITTDYKIQTSFYAFIKVLFKQPRKTILNNLRVALDGKKIKNAGINPNDRPQNLTLEQIVRLAKIADSTS